MENLVTNYFSEIDVSLEKLSQNFEENLTGLPSWVLSTRKIAIGHIEEADFYIIKVIADDQLEADELQKVHIRTNTELQRFTVPFKMNFKVENCPKDFGCTMISDMHAIGKDRIDALPVSLFSGLLCLVSGSQIPIEFSPQKAKEHALDLWNKAAHGLGLPKGHSFLSNLRSIFTTFHRIVKRKAFLEERIHRFINFNSKFLLPPHKKCHFKHELYLNDEKRVADFILQRERALPSMLIELENPSVKMFKKNGEWTAEANHARNQIAEWARFIEQNPANTQGQFSFLNGPKQRLVIMDRGLEHLDEMINSKYQDTVMWTYDLLAKEAKDYWNSIIIEQCRLLGIANPNTLG